MKNKLIKKLDEVFELRQKDINSFAPLFSDKSGIINALLERFELEKFDLNMFQCLSTNTKTLFELTREISSGGLGVDKYRREAMLSCLSEAIERYCVSYINKDDLTFCRWNELPRNQSLNKFNLYTEGQYKNNKLFPNPIRDKIYWAKISSFLETPPKKEIYYPASLIYMPFDISNSVAETTSTGLAAHTNIKSAVKNGVLELIERDAIMINMLRRLNPPEINSGSIKGINQEFIKKINKRYNIKIYKLYSDINIPVYLSFIWRSWQDKLHFGIGASANLDSCKAIRKSLEECLFTYFYSKNILDLKPTSRTSITKLYEHFLYYQDKKFFDLLFNSETKNYSKENLSWDHLTKELRDNKLDIYYKDLTTEDINPFGIRVVRTIIPELVDLNKSYTLRREGADRFWTVPAKLRIKGSQNLSTLPHPFP